MALKNHNKIPKALLVPVESKTPKAGAFPTDGCHPEFRTEQMDKEGPWGWTGSQHKAASLRIHPKAIFNGFFNSNFIFEKIET